ncbi:hypothetical protein FACS1894178_9310 [Bacteroidia bacterium]|nr:hypothetical protein FACS1894178_9310 [Bacteroidia bacterium]
MKKGIVLLIFAAMIIGSSCAQKHQTKTSWELDGLKGKVKSLRTITYEAIDTLGKIAKGNIVDNVYGSILINYNRKGGWIEYRSYTPAGKNRWAEIPSFDEKGNRMERRDYIFSESDSTLHRRYSNKYDNKGNLTTAFLYNASDSLIWKRSYVYDNKGNETEICSYNATDILNWKVICAYDSKSNLIEENVYSASGNLDSKTIYKYDSKGNRIEQCGYKSDDSLESKTTYQYDENGFQVEVCKYNADGKLDKRFAYKYKYDTKGNWIEKIDYKDDVAVRIYERKIEYYK